MNPLIAKNITGKALTAGLLLCLFIAFCRSFRMPIIWSTNYWLINFFDGFGRRALLGTLLYPFGEWRNHYHFIAAIQIATSAALLYLIITRLAAWQQESVENRTHTHTYIYIYIYIYIWILPFVLWFIFLRLCRIY